MLAAVDGAGYKILLLIHIISVVLAFGPNFVAPMLRRNGASGEALGKIAKTIQMPSVVVAFLGGIGLVAMSDSSWTFSQSWVSMAFLVAILSGVVLYLLAGAYEKNEGQHVAMYSGVLHLLLVVGVFLMIWKPGV